MKTFYERDLQVSQRKPFSFHRWDTRDSEEYEKYCFHTDTVDKVLLISCDNTVTEVGLEWAKSHSEYPENIQAVIFVKGAPKYWRCW